MENIFRFLKFPYIFIPKEFRKNYKEYVLHLYAFQYNFDKVHVLYKLEKTKFLFKTTYRYKAVDVAIIPAHVSVLSQETSYTYILKEAVKKLKLDVDDFNRYKIKSYLRYDTYENVLYYTSLTSETNKSNLIPH